MRIPADCQIERVVSTDETRESLSAGAYYEPSRKRIVATDGHMLVSVPVQPDTEDHEGYISAEALKAARQTFKKRGSDPQIIANGSQSIPGGPTFPRPGVGKLFPPIDQVIPASRKDDPGTITICLNVDFLVAIAKALGADQKNGTLVSLTIRVPKPESDDYDADEPHGQKLRETKFGESLEPIVVAGGAHAAIGVLMPCRL